MLKDRPKPFQSLQRRPRTKGLPQRPPAKRVRAWAHSGSVENWPRAECRLRIAAKRTPPLGRRCCGGRLRVVVHDAAQWGATPERPGRAGERAVVRPVIVGATGGPGPVSPGWANVREQVASSWRTRHA